MPYIITRCWYPLHKAGEPGKKYLEVMEKYPPDESIAKPIVPAAVTSTKDGIGWILNGCAGQLVAIMKGGTYD